MKHLVNNKETYLSHLVFAGKIGLTLIFRGFIFLLHAIFPLCNIPRRWNLSNVHTKVSEWNSYAIRRLKE